MPSASSTFGPYPCASGNIITLVRPDGMRIPLHRELVPLSSMLIDVTEARGHNLPAYGTWGAACRYISGTRIWSNHARGCAIDFDAPNNPYASADWHRRNGNAVIFGKRVRTNIPQWVFELWEAHGFYCGVRYDSKPDPMHFEFIRPVSECRLITKRLQGLLNHPDAALPKPAPPKPKPIEENDVMLIVHCPGQPSRCWNGPTCPVLDAPTTYDMAKNGVKQANVSKGFYENMLKHCNEALGRE